MVCGAAVCVTLLFIIFAIFCSNGTLFCSNILYLLDVVVVDDVSFSSYLKGIYCFLCSLESAVILFFESPVHQIIFTFCFGILIHSQLNDSRWRRKQIKEKTAKRTQPCPTRIYLFLYRLPKMGVKPPTYFTFPSYFRILRQSNEIDKICKRTLQTMSIGNAFYVDILRVIVAVVSSLHLFTCTRLVQN